ncbi:hypothetical protein [Shewanella sp. UCD-KL12]|uniref:hypothetical protein n=1 Tax=Shewanella sp. UCD-KL12 TaxID=1917163 RepID=UPI00211659ED|nr:hypothetical protein [Shewanella sp. UCD-KL12]
MPKYMKAILFNLVCVLLFPTTLYANEQYPALEAAQWSYATDPYGSIAKVKNKLITEEGVWINFNRIPRVDPQRNSWIEVIYTPDPALLLGTNKITLTYKCDTPLLIKLSQTHYGKQGDKSYAHYQVKLPAASQWRPQEVELNDFARPDWTPMDSIDYGIVLEKVNALYLTPSLTDKDGGLATLQIRSLTLKK